MDDEGDKNYYGSISGKIAQADSKAKIVACQEVDIDSTVINVDGTFRIENLPIGNYDLTIKSSTYRIYELLNVKVNNETTTYIGEIDLSNIPDLVSHHIPENYDNLGLPDHISSITISIAFTRQMDKQSVEDAFSTFPETEGQFYWGIIRDDPYITDYYADNWYESYNNTYTQYDNSAFTFRIAQKDLYADTTYYVTLSTNAKDIRGNQLRFPLEFSFTTQQNSSQFDRIITYPNNGDIIKDLIIYEGIQVLFHKDIDQMKIENSININLCENPILYWPNDRELIIDIGGVFFADTFYSISIDTLQTFIEEPFDNVPFTFSFQTALPQIIKTIPYNGNLNAPIRSEIELEFNTFVNIDSVITNFSINPNILGDFIYGRSFYHTGHPSYVTFIPSNNLDSNTVYTVTIGGGAEDLYGTNIKEPYIFSFKTGID